VPFVIEYSPDAEEHLCTLPAHQRALVLDTVDEQLQHQPTVETRHRKPMRPNLVAPYELRIGNLRVYYDVRLEPAQTVFIRAIGEKIHNRVRIGGEEVEL
jgi:mRNA-degrading endonuclease RelE of RelBE toxin-antitoxin system